MPAKEREYTNLIREACTHAGWEYKLWTNEDWVAECDTDPLCQIMLDYYKKVPDPWFLGVMSDWIRYRFLSEDPSDQIVWCDTDIRPDFKWPGKEYYEWPTWPSGPGAYYPMCEPNKAMEHGVIYIKGSAAKKPMAHIREALREHYMYCYNHYPLPDNKHVSCWRVVLKTLPQYASLRALPPYICYFDAYKDPDLCSYLRHCHHAAWYKRS